MRRSEPSSPRPRKKTGTIAAAFDELRFGRERTLDLRATLPTAAEASHRAELFLRARQVTSVEECLIITGRGNQSVDGVPVVRPAVERVLARLRRGGVIERWSEHTAGSFVVVPAPLHALFEAPRRYTDRRHETAGAAEAFDGLEPATQGALRQLAIGMLQILGAPTEESFVHDEMQRQFSLLAAAIPQSPDRELRLRAALERALRELDDAD